MLILGFLVPGTMMNKKRPHNAKSSGYRYITPGDTRMRYFQDIIPLSFNMVTLSLECSSMPVEFWKSDSKIVCSVPLSFAEID